MDGRNERKKRARDKVGMREKPRAGRGPAGEVSLFSLYLFSHFVPFAFAPTSLSVIASLIDPGVRTVSEQPTKVVGKQH